MKHFDFTHLEAQLTENQLTDVRNTYGQLYRLVENLPHITPSHETISLKVETVNHGLETETIVTPVLGAELESADELREVLIELDTRTLTGEYDLSLDTITTSDDKFDTIDGDYTLDYAQHDDNILGVEFNPTIYTPPLHVTRYLCTDEQAVSDALQEVRVNPVDIGNVRDLLGQFYETCAGVEGVELQADLLWEVEVRQKVIIITPYIETSADESTASAITSTFINETDLDVCDRDYREEILSLKFNQYTLREEN